MIFDKFLPNQNGNCNHNEDSADINIARRSNVFSQMVVFRASIRTSSTKRTPWTKMADTSLFQFLEKNMVEKDQKIASLEFQMKAIMEVRVVNVMLGWP